MTLGAGCMHGRVGTSCRVRCVCPVMRLSSQLWRIQARSVRSALRFFITSIRLGHTILEMSTLMGHLQPFIEYNVLFMRILVEKAERGQSTMAERGSYTL